MKHLQLPAALIMLLALPAAVLADIGRDLPNRYTVYADVIDVQPSYRRISVEEPHRECWVEQQEHVVRYEGQQHGYPTAYRAPVRSAPRESRGNTASVIAGGVIGGVIGNQLGRNGSSGRRTGATVAGAIVGSVVGNEVGNARHRREPATVNRYETRHYSRPVRQPVYETRPVEQCRTTVSTRQEQRVDGYEVTYRHDGQTFRTYSRRDPGRQIELQVSLQPARQ